NSSTSMPLASHQPRTGQAGVAFSPSRVDAGRRARRRRRCVRCSQNVECHGRRYDARRYATWLDHQEVTVVGPTGSRIARRFEGKRRRRVRHAADAEVAVVAQNHSTAPGVDEDAFELVVAEEAPLRIEPVEQAADVEVELLRYRRDAMLAQYRSGLGRVLDA